MPGYINIVIVKFKHSIAPCPQHTPHTFTCPNYGAKTQFTPLPEKSNKLNVKGKLHVQEVVGTMMCYVRSVNLSLLVVVGAIMSQQETLTENTATTLS